MMKNSKRKKGFTLIELIIVVAIIGVLAAIAVPKFGSIQQDAKRKADIASAKVIADATSMAIVNNETFSVPGAPVAADIEKYLPQFPTPQLISGTFTITVLDDSVKVMADSDKSQTIAGVSLTDESIIQLFPVPSTIAAPYDK